MLIDSALREKLRARRRPGPRRRTYGHGPQARVWACLRMLGTTTEWTVTGIAEATGVPRLTVSHYVTALRKANVVELIAPARQTQQGSTPAVYRTCYGLGKYAALVRGEGGRRVADDLVKGEETRVRGTGDEARGNQMLYSYQAFAAGTQLVVHFTLDRYTSDNVRGALARGLMEWDRYIRGQGRQGRGLMRIISSKGLSTSEAYDDHVVQNADAMRAGILQGTLGAGKPICKG